MDLRWGLPGGVRNDHHNVLLHLEILKKCQEMRHQTFAVRFSRSFYLILEFNSIYIF